MNDDFFNSEDELREEFFNTTNFVDCSFINLNELYQLSERGIVGKGRFSDLNEWSFFYV
tara:strand:+ start:411 stop:587 length:177 start_codon:yes stop_codon:yes gene_type:complete